jgi:GMP reductase
MTANMATCGTFEMARVMSKHKMITTFHKYYTIEQYKEFFETFDEPDYICYTL